MWRCCPLMAIVPISLFLTLSFFILLALSKVTEKGLKILGYLAASCLLLSALVILSSAVSNFTQNSGGLRCTIPQKMKMCGMMQKKNMPDMRMPEKGTRRKRSQREKEQTESLEASTPSN